MNDKNVLIAGASQGFGHMKAAENIAKEFAIEGLQGCSVVDIFDYYPPVFRFISVNFWKTVSTKFHSFYSYFYKTSISSNFNSYLITKISNIVARRLIEEYSNRPPDIFIATHSLAVPIGEILKEHFNCRFGIVATDFILHTRHLSRAADMIFVPPECKMILSNSERERIKKSVYNFGIPIAPEFSDTKNIANIKKRLGLDPGLKTALITFGGEGLLSQRHTRLIEEIKRAKLPLQFLVLTGRNKMLNLTMNALYKRDSSVKIIGFTENVSDYYAAADIFIGKAGGLSISEAIVTKLPMFFVDKMPGQEEFNINVMAKKGLGKYTPSTVGLISEIGRTLTRKAAGKEKKFSGMATPKSSRNIVANMLK